MDQFLYSLYTVVAVALTLWAVRVWQRSRSVGTLMIVILLAALIYENGVLALGVVIGHGPLLEALSWLRFIGYAVFPPLLVVTGVELARRAGMPWAAGRSVQIGAWVVAIGLAALALVVEVFSRQLEPRVLNDVVRYMWTTRVPPIAVVLMTLLLIVCGIAVWRKTRNPLLFAGALFQLIGAGLAAGKYVIGSGIELIFMVFLLGAELWALRTQSPAAEPETPLVRQGAGD